MKRVIPRGFLPVLAFAFLHSQVGFATIVSVNNADFEQLGNAGSFSGNFGVASQLIGLGPWSGTSVGTIGLQGPTLTIDDGGFGGTDGKATISGLASISTITLIANSGEFFQMLTGMPFLPNTPYRLSVDITTGSAPTLTSLRNSGIGIGAGTALVPGFFKSTTAPAGDVTLVSAGLTGRLTFNFTTPGIIPFGDARLRLYAGDFEGITTVSVISSVTFDNVLFEIVPEPSSLTLILAGCLGLARRRRWSFRRSEAVVAKPRRSASLAACIRC
jgi:hypothetical protein